MRGNGQRRTLVLAIAILVVMVGMVAASVPLYSLLCRATGLSGTPRRVMAASGEQASAKTMTIRFDASVMRGLPWKFAPGQTKMTVHLGETTLATFTAHNSASTPLTGTASFNVTPLKAAPYVDKIACFCFTEQKLEPGQTVDMPVTFYVDPKIADDPETNDIDTITLSYTFFQARPPAARSEGPS
jgi:cytochrome c oxidase assembly protein subunit 11